MKVAGRMGGEGEGIPTPEGTPIPSSARALDEGDGAGGLIDEAGMEVDMGVEVEVEEEAELEEGGGGAGGEEEA